MKAIPFIDLKRQYAAVGPALRKAALRVLDSGSYILGPEGAAFEKEFSKALGAPHAVGVSSGTAALRLALEALGVGPGDEVIVPAFTFIATATAVSAAGAKPVFADVSDRTLTLDPGEAGRGTTRKTKALLPVHLYGQAADIDALRASCRRLKILEDCAQSHLTRYKGRTAGTLGDIAAFSFYPSKNLGAAGDAGAIVTKSRALYDRVVELHNVGRKPAARYEHVRVGHNSRLDELQAAILRVKLARLADWTRERRRVAALYADGLQGLPLRLPELGQNGGLHSFHLYVVRTARRDALAKHLTAAGVGCGVYYPIPLHLQPAYKGLGYKPGDFPVSEKAAREVLALPMFPELSDAEAARVIREIRRFFKA